MADNFECREVVRFAENRATAGDILFHLSRLDLVLTSIARNQLTPEAYADKLAKHANLFEAWCHESLVGLVAAYVNAGPVGYISHVGVVPEFGGRGIGRALLCECIDSARRAGLRGMELTVLRSNQIARRLYVRCGFHVVRSSGDNAVMSVDLVDGQYPRIGTAL